MKQDTQATGCRRQNDFCPCRSCSWEGLHDDGCSVHEPGEEQAAYLDGVLPYCDCGLRAKVQTRTRTSERPPQAPDRRPGFGSDGCGAAKAPRVVIADDLDDARAILAGALRRAAFEVIEACDGEELLAATSELRHRGHTVDAVVADIDMPRRDGVQASRHLRDLIPAVPIVLITGLRDERVIAGARAAGASAILQRPFAAAELVAVVEQLVGEQRAAH